MSDALFRKCLAASFALHFGLFLLSRLSPRAVPPVEIDLTMAFLGGAPGAPKLAAPKKLVPGAQGIAAPAEKELPVAKPDQPQELTTGPGTAQPAPEPETATPGGAVDGTGTSHKVGGEGAGSNYGVPGGTGGGGSPVTKMPRLLNLDEVRANLRRFYPEAERRAGREGSVLVHLHIGADGAVTMVEVAQSAGPAFDEAAKKVGRLMRFAPAEAGGGPVAVKVPQPMQFKLER